MEKHKKRINFHSNVKNNVTEKPSTVTRAAITAEIKLTRGRQLVEHAPVNLIPDPNNPRPGEIIDDAWIKKNLSIGYADSKCYLDKVTGNYVIPEFSELLYVSTSIEDDYNFLRNLAYSIRVEGLIEPIEIFLADRNNDPDYFVNSDLEFGYVVLEGHQRRLAAIMAGVSTVTCIEITDETALARLKVKHRKLRRQLSENNLRKGLTVGQNYLITKELLNSYDGKELSVKELASIVGLNEDIAGVLKRLAINKENYPQELFDAIQKNIVSFKWLRKWIGKPKKDILEALFILKGLNHNTPFQETIIKKEKARGTNGGAVKRSVTFKVTNEDETITLKSFLLSRIPELKIDKNITSSFKELESLLYQLVHIAKKNISDPGRI